MFGNILNKILLFKIHVSNHNLLFIPFKMFCRKTATYIQFKDCL